MKKAKLTYLIVLCINFVLLLASFVVELITSNPGRYLKSFAYINNTISTEEVNSIMNTESEINFYFYEVSRILWNVFVILLAILVMYFLQKLVVFIINCFKNKKIVLPNKMQIFIPLVLTFVIFSSIFTVQCFKLDNYSKTIEKILTSALYGKNNEFKIIVDDNNYEEIIENDDENTISNVKINRVYYENVYDAKCLICYVTYNDDDYNYKVKYYFEFKNDNQVEQACKIDFLIDENNS